MNPTVERGTALIIRTDGREEVFKLKEGNKKLWASIGAGTLDFVRIGKADGSDLMMAVDDNGWETETIDHGGGHFELRPVRALKPINAKATELYRSICVPGVKHQIAGDVAIVHDEDFA